MKYLSIIVSLPFYLLAYSQREAYYIGTLAQTDLIHTQTIQEKTTIIKSFSFMDTIKEASTIGEESFYFPFQLNKRSSPDTTAIVNVLPYEAISTYKIDSLLVAGKWYYIEEFFSDDGWIGGRPNQVNKQITVTELGVIYSSSNFIGSHQLMMLCHNDDSLQQVLLQVYDHLDRKKQPWNYWDKCRELSSAYPFSTAFADLTKRWLSSRNDLKLVNSHASCEGTTVHYAATIRNVSQTHYWIPRKTSVAPARAEIIYSNDFKSEWNLLQTSYGQHFRQLNEPYYLDPGDTVQITCDFPVETNSGTRSYAFEGFQFLSYYRLLWWLVTEPEVRNGKKYVNFPYREVKI